MKAKKDDAICDFCGTHHDFRMMLITSRSERDHVHICDDCIEHCFNLLQEKKAEAFAKSKESP